MFAKRIVPCLDVKAIMFSIFAALMFALFFGGLFYLMFSAIRNLIERLDENKRDNL